MKKALLALFFVGSVFSLSALDIRDGLVRIRIDEINGRVLLYRMTNVSGSQYEPIFFDSDPRTSTLMVSIDGRKARLGDSSEYKFNVRRTATGAEVEYSSVVATITEKISFIKSLDSRVSNGFKVEYVIKNLSSREYKVMLRRIWDTRLGEPKGRHFSSNLSDKIEDEQVFTAESPESYVMTPGESASMAVLLAKVPRPDAVVIANWKRLSDAAWMYSTYMKGFSMAPYSLNDSAIGFFWDERILKPGASVVFTSYLVTGGPWTEFRDALISGGYGINEDLPGVQLTETGIARKNPGLDIEAIRQLLALLDSAIDNIDAISESDITMLMNQVDDLLNPYEAIK